MRVKLLKSVIINAVSNTEPQPVDAVVEVDDAEGREMVNMGYAEETSAKVTAEAKQAPAPDNKMAADPANKQAPEAARNRTPVAPPVKTAAAKTVGTVSSGKR